MRPDEFHGRLYVWKAHSTQYQNKVAAQADKTGVSHVAMDSVGLLEVLKQEGFPAIEKRIEHMLPHCRDPNQKKIVENSPLTASIPQSQVPSLFTMCKKILLGSALFSTKRKGNVFIRLTPLLAHQFLSEVLGDLERVHSRNLERISHLKSIAQLLVAPAGVTKLTLPSPLISAYIIYWHRMWVMLDLVPCFQYLQELHVDDSCRLKKHVDAVALGSLDTLEVLRLPKAVPLLFEDFFKFYNLKELECGLSDDLDRWDAAGAEQPMRLQRLVILEAPAKMSAAGLVKLVSLLPKLMRLHCHAVLLKHKDYDKSAAELFDGLEDRHIFLEHIELRKGVVPPIWIWGLCINYLKVVGPLSEDNARKMRKVPPYGVVGSLELDSVQPAFIPGIVKALGPYDLTDLVISADASTARRITRRHHNEFDFLVNEVLDLSAILANAPLLKTFFLNYAAPLTISSELSPKHFQTLKQFHICPEALGGIWPHELKMIYRNFLLGSANLDELMATSSNELEQLVEVMKTHSDWGATITKITFSGVCKEEFLIQAYEVGALLLLRGAKLELITFKLAGAFGSAFGARVGMPRTNIDYWCWSSVGAPFRPLWFWHLMRAAGVTCEMIAMQGGHTRTYKMM